MMSVIQYSPRITFQDTNIVGNVYFLSYFRWQLECWERWRGSVGLSPNGRASCEQPVVRSWSTDYEDPFGVTIGDEVTVALGPACRDSDDDLSAEIFARTSEGRRRIATGRLQLATPIECARTCEEDPVGSCYTFDADVSDRYPVEPLKLVEWQGKCRELFLADHAGETLRRVANRELILQTTQASLTLVRTPPNSTRRVRVQMRLESLKCGQIAVRFDYYAEAASAPPVRIAKGRQRMSSKHQRELALVPCPLPEELLLALREFAGTPELLQKIDDIISFSSTVRREIAVSVQLTR